MLDTCSHGGSRNPAYAVSPARWSVAGPAGPAGPAATEADAVRPDSFSNASEGACDGFVAHHESL